MRRIRRKLGLLLSCLAATALAGLSWAGVEKRATSEPRLAEAPVAQGRPVPFRSFLTSEQMTAIRGGLSVDRQDRAAVAAFFDAHYTPNLSVPSGWVGDVDTCNAGSTSQAYIDATIDLVNFYRAMVGLPSVTNQVSDNSGAQEAALMMSANGMLDHEPPNTWDCYTVAGDNSAYESNLALGAAGPDAIELYMEDPGTFNYPVGHRRWILYPVQGAMGTGSLPSSSRGSYSAANALDVFGPTVSRPSTPVAVTWPPEGFVPYPLVYDRWSFALNTFFTSVEYTSASVTMTHDGSPIDLTVLDLFPDPVKFPDSYLGDKTIVWEPDLSGIDIEPGMSDTTVTVTVSGITHGTTTSMTYDVTIFDPATEATEIFSDGFESGGTSAWI